MHWIPEKVPPFVEIDGREFPSISEEWEKTLFEMKNSLCSKCPKCFPPNDLCDEHFRTFQWLVTLGYANVPRRYWGLEIEDSLLPETDSALRFVRNACDKVEEVVSRGLGFSIFGSKGRGKTTLTTYFLKTALRHGIPGYFVLMESLMGLIKDSFDSDFQKERLNMVKNIGVLVLDDLGREYLTNTGFVLARLDELFRFRDAMCLTTIFSSNLSGDEFKARYGAGIISLLKNTNEALALSGQELRPALNEWKAIKGSEGE
jgi:DNA replication protein DnaC